jgi:hypothetical protein
MSPDQTGPSNQFSLAPSLKIVWLPKLTWDGLIRAQLGDMLSRLSALRRVDGEIISHRKYFMHIPNVASILLRDRFLVNFE